MPDMTQVNTYAAAVGTSSSDPFVTHFSPTSPTAQNTQFPLQKRWVDITTSAEYILANFSSSGGVITANWIELTGGSANLETLTGNSGGAVSGAGNINMVGDSTTINIVGVPSTSTLTANVILPATAHQVLVGETSSIVGISPSTAGYVLTSNGTGADPSFKPVSSLGAFQSINIQTFTSTGTYTPSAGMVYCLVQMVGGGGGGGGSGATSSSNVAAGGGGGGGEYAYGYFSSTTIGASQTVTCGAGGTGASGTGSSTAGGTTSLGALITAAGGQPGLGAAGAVCSGNVGGVGGTGGTGGSFHSAGGCGSIGLAIYLSGAAYSLNPGAGGNSFFGGAAVAGVNNNGNAGTVGGGGSGASTQISGGSAFSGGNGGGGVVVITEFIS